MFQCSQQIRVVCSCKRYCVLSGFHRQQSLGLLRGLLYLEVCKTRSASGIESEITTFRKSLFDIFVLSCALFFSEDRKSLFHAISVPTCHSHSISRHRPRKSSTCATLLRARRLIAKAGIACEQWCPYIERHRAPLCVLLTHVWMETSLYT